MIQAYTYGLTQISIPELKGHSNVKFCFCDSPAETEVYLGTIGTEIPEMCALHSPSCGTVLSWVDDRT